MTKDKSELKWIDYTDYCPSAKYGEDPQEPWEYRYCCPVCDYRFLTKYSDSYPDVCPKCKTMLYGAE